MKLQVPFVQLPLHFDAQRLAAEISVFGEDVWRPHPLGYAGNSALALIAVDGNPDSDGFVGPMQPTPHLLRCPYLMQVLASFGAVLGRARLMRLSGQAEVEPHVDINYYWHDRVRVHVPILTQPSVRFVCGDAEVNMAAGECWVFDTWRLHRVINAADDQRIHLVADTIGSEGFWQIINAGRAPGHRMPPQWASRRVEPQERTVLPELMFESVNAPIVMTPWEAREHVGFLFNEAVAHADLNLARAACQRFLGRWQALWARFGESRTGWPEYRRELDAFEAEFRPLAAVIELRNGGDFTQAMMSLVVRMALADRTVSLADQAMESARQAPVILSATSADPWFERPIFIVSPPRSGSTLLFETLSAAPDVFTIGDESHVLIESIPELHPGARDYDSNELGAGAATPQIIARIRASFHEALRDRDDKAATVAPVRMLEKTPKNALRIPFLARVFPQAHFIYLHRDPREVLASMIEAWSSQRFRTYPKLPGWTGLDWSLVLVPGWRDLIGKPLAEIVAAQWQTTTRILLDDLSALPASSVSVASYADLLADPSAEIARLCAAVDLRWDRALDAQLPLSRYTLSTPAADKWRKHGDAILAVLPGIDATMQRAARFVASGSPA